jgi:hypothetical protein
MVVTVTYDGVTLVDGANARSEDGGWFVEIEQPMPVGTVIDLTGEVQATGTVIEVHEGAGAGMRVKRTASPPARQEAPPANEPADPPEDRGGGKGKRRRSKTVIGR